ncbi:MAG: AMP-binding protein [Bacillota bacterium]|nr:AMP-binding protein [Bacillota bacterium]
MDIIGKYLDRTEFESYEDFCENFRLKVPEDFDFARDVVDAWAASEPDKTALIYCDDGGREKRLNFAELSLLSRQAAAYFAELGVKPGHRVLTLLRRRYEYWICAVALHRMGAVLVPASIQLTEKDIAYRIQNAEARYIIAVEDDFVLEQLGGLKSSCPTLQDIIVVGDQPPVPYRDFNREYVRRRPFEGYSGLSNNDEMVIYFTSGTSGYPKMAIHDRSYPLGHIVTAKYMQRVRNNGLHLTQADSGWAKFGWGNIYGQWICGSAILAYDPIRFDPRRLMEVMKKYRPTSLCIPPTMYRFLLRSGLKREHVASVRWFSTAGEPLSGHVNQEFYRITGHHIHEAFGQSEGTPITCSFEWLDIRPSSMGKPSPLYDVAIVRPDGSPCRANEEGEVVIFTGKKGRLGLLSNYFADGEPLDPIRDGVYHTGDIAFADEEGYYWYVGRNDDMIKSSGYRVGPFEIESILNTHRSVKESAVVGYPDALRGQVICAVVALREGYDKSEELTKELQDYVKRNTAPYKYPRLVKYVPELPKTTSGKIIRKDLATAL